VSDFGLSAQGNVDSRQTASPVAVLFTSRLEKDRSSESPIVPVELNRLIRAFGLVWGRLGSARVYVAAFAGLVVILAAIGIWHLVSPRKPIELTARKFPVVKATPPLSNQPGPASSPTQSARARTSPSAEQSLTPTAPSFATAPAVIEKQVEITKIEQTENRGPHGETLVVATIGLASLSIVEKGGVEIRVYFYDLTAENEIRPTDAQGTYQWLTPVRDWSDPSPKYLAATYVKRPVRQRSFEKLRYGGFVVRVFSGGKLQDERSQPEALLSPSRKNASDEIPVASPRANSSPTPFPTAAKRTMPITSPSPVRSEPQESALPYGKAIPGKPGFLYSPYDPKFIIDVRGFPPGTLVNDPNGNKPFRVP